MPDKNDLSLTPLKDRGRRNPLDAAQEWLSTPSRKLKGIFDQQYKQIMDSLVKADNHVRAIASGTVIKGMSPDDKISMKQLLKDARSKFNRREYLVVASLLGRYHKKMDDILKAVKDYNIQFDKIHNKFLFAPLEDRKEKERGKHIEHLRSLKQRLGEAPHPEYFIKEAGILDMFHNLRSNRGRALSRWERDYARAGQIRDKAEDALVKAEAMQLELINTLKDMANARASNNMQGWTDLVKSFPQIYKDFDASFKKFYTEEVKPALEQHEMFNGQAEEKKNEVAEALKTKLPEEQSKDLAKQEVKPSTTTQNFPMPSMMSGQYVGGPQGPAPIKGLPAPLPPLGQPFIGGPTFTSSPGPAPAAAPSQPPPPESGPQPIAQPAAPAAPAAPAPAAAAPAAKSSKVRPRKGTSADDGLVADDGEVVTAHRKFYATLEAMGNEHPLVLGAYIRKYARSIQTSDPETAIKLFGIAKQLKG